MIHFKKYDNVKKWKKKCEKHQNNVAPHNLSTVAAHILCLWLFRVFLSTSIPGDLVVTILSSSYMRLQIQLCPNINLEGNNLQCKSMCFSVTN